MTPDLSAALEAKLYKAGHPRSIQQRPVNSDPVAIPSEIAFLSRLREQAKGEWKFIHSDPVLAKSK